MSAPVNLTKALMTAIQFDKAGRATAIKPRIDVQFNPESLKLAYANSMQGGNQQGGGSMQFVGQSTTKLSFDLWFDVSAPMPKREGESGADVARAKDVRRLTKYVVDFMKPKKTMVEETENGATRNVERLVPPAVRFGWGAFEFDGIVESVNETIDFFSSEGHALRSQLSVSMSKQDFPPEIAQGSDPGGGMPVPGTNLQQMVAEGQALQMAAANLGNAENWQQIATANDIEDPRNLPAGSTFTLS